MPKSSGGRTHSREKTIPGERESRDTHAAARRDGHTRAVLRRIPLVTNSALGLEKGEFSHASNLLSIIKTILLDYSKIEIR